MNWNYPAYIFVGRRKTYPIQILMKKQQLHFYEPIQQKNILVFDYLDIRLFVDKNNQTLFRIFYKNSQPIILLSPFRSLIVRALHTYNSLLTNSPELLQHLSRNCPISAPVISCNGQHLMVINQDDMQLENAMGEVSHRIPFGTVKKIDIRNGYIQIFYSDTDRIEINVVEEMYRPLIYTCLASRILHSQEASIAQHQAAFAFTTTELSEDNDLVVEGDTGTKVVGPERGEEEAADDEELSYDGGGAQLLLQTQDISKATQLPHGGHSEGNGDLSFLGTTNNLLATEQMQLQQTMADAQTQSSWCYNDELPAQQQTVQMEEQEPTNPGSVNEILNNLQELQASGQVVFNQKLSSLLDKMRKPVYCYKYMARRKKFHKVVVFLPKEADRENIRVCWGTEKLAQKCNREHKVDVFSSPKPVSFYQWDVNRQIDVHSFHVGLSKAHQYIQDAFRGLSFKVDNNQIFCLYSQKSKREMLCLVFQSGAKEFDRNLRDLFKLKESAGATD